MTADSRQSERSPRISLDLVLNERGRPHDHENIHLFLVTPLEREIKPSKVRDETIDFSASVRNPHCDGLLLTSRPI